MGEILEYVIKNHSLRCILVFYDCFIDDMEDHLEGRTNKIKKKLGTAFDFDLIEWARQLEVTKQFREELDIEWVV